MIRIGGSEIEAGKDPYVIAEIGSNWKSFEDAYSAVQIAKECGANAVKFQFFDHQSLYGFTKPKNSAYDVAYDMPYDYLEKLKQRADQIGIDFLCTCFNHLHVKSIDSLVFAHKVASSDINYTSLLRELDKMGKPVFLSTGASNASEIKYALSILESVPVILMYCVSAYPARSIDLTLIESLKELSDYVGYSDHTLDATYVPYAAYKYHGAVALEKHLTTIKEQTPDSPHSLNPARFKLMVDRIKGKRKVHLGPTADETDMVLRHKRRLIATQDNKKGETLFFNRNFGAYRSLKLNSKYLGPEYADEIDGRHATKDIEAGEALVPGDY